MLDISTISLSRPFKTLFWSAWAVSNLPNSVFSSDTLSSNCAAVCDCDSTNISCKSLLITVWTIKQYEFRKVLLIFKRFNTFHTRNWNDYNSTHPYDFHASFQQPMLFACPAIFSPLRPFAIFDHAGNDEKSKEFKTGSMLKLFNNI